MANDDNKTVNYDISSQEVVTTAIMEMLNDYPGLNGAEVAFSTLGESNGIAMYPISSAVIQSETINIIGGVTQICLYPFHVVYRASGLSESRKASVKEWLDNLGRWLEKEEITINGINYKLSQYPELTGDRKIEKISRQTPGYLDTINENQSENWVIYITLQYINKYEQ